MNEKRTRQQVIIRLVSKNKIANQEELQSLLRKEGVNATQATLSRDLKELKIIKIHNRESGYSYSLPQQRVQPPLPATGEPLSGINSIEFSGNLAVMKTRPGFASMIASIVDSRIGQEMMGTIAGDDTVLMILRYGSTPESLLGKLSSFIPGIEAKLI